MQAEAAPSLGKADSIEIALTFDDGFWAPCYATMRSVCLTTHNPRQIRFHLLHRMLTPEHRAALESIGTEYGATMNFIDIDARALLDERIASLPKIRMRRFSKVIYARLFLADLLDKDIERVLYLDCDVFVRAALDPLFFMDMQGHAIAAVVQPDRIHCVAGTDLRTRNAFSMAEPYFNSGVMLIDMAQYREMDFLQTLSQGLPESELAMFYYDQDIINFCFKHRILELENTWNLQNAEPAHEVLNPTIVHYSANDKPWVVWSRVAFKRTYRHLMTNAYFYQYRRERILRSVKRLFRLA
ncbi:hypothetical protein WH87_08400 [Devosia epidermidihirudinis]|uniref:Uncharacterized protein n=1 Tax=Devosia epidermidihirudinis TaxID=1293439 RepID=A0A0F5QAI7_9HYPH|nr:hypothetical protein WH87_08400 [Devosia epidermidihirudinis]